jgi:N-sulfoglucosamine sulfohydrolase
MRSSILNILMVLPFALGTLSCSSDKKDTQTPNILFILTDDQSKIDMGAYGNAHLKTPNMDQFINEGMAFENAFTSTAMCVPSRSSLYTGLYPMRHGAHPNHAAIRSGVTSVANNLEKLGYKVGLIGKIHIRPDSIFDFHYQKDLLDFAWDTKLTKEEMILAMETLGAEGNPFALFICISNPHTPWPGEWDNNPDVLDLPPHLFDNEKSRLTLSRYYAHVKVADNKVGEAVESAKELNLYDDMVVFLSSDHGAEFVHGKYTLYDAGLRVPFAVRWPGHIQAGTRSQALISFVDVVPTMIDIAGGEPDESLDGKSILPVLLQDSEEINDYIFATSSKDGNKTDYPIKAIRTKKYKYILNPEFEETYTSWITDSTLGDKWPGYDRHYGYWLTWLDAAETDPWAEKLVNDYLHRPAEELFDLESDPNEFNNIAGDPSVNEIKLELRAKLKKWMIDQGDVHYSESFFDALPE